MEHFVTLFDQVFLPQGLSLHMSMQRHIKDYTLWILCMENEVFEILAKMNVLILVNLFKYMASSKSKIIFLLRNIFANIIIIKKSIL